MSPPADRIQRWAAYADLLALAPRGRQVQKQQAPLHAQTISLRCDRTLPFEFIDTYLTGYLSLWQRRHTLYLSDYDAALAQLTEPSTGYDARLVWLDWRLYPAMLSPKAAVDWLFARISAAATSPAPWLINNWPTGGDAWYEELRDLLTARIAENANTILVDLHALQNDVNGPFFDPRNDIVANNPFSNAACIAIARHLGADILPTLLQGRLKGIIVDLDDTLYAGVLGEDGPQGVQLTAGHRLLQQHLHALKQSGILLGLCSHNNLEDVENLFNQRRDFNLQWDDFAATQVNWQAKATNMQKIAEAFHVAPETLLVVDDNAAELLQIDHGMQTLLARPNAAETLCHLRHFPGLFAVKFDTAAELRSRDVAANRARASLQEQAKSPRAYLESLQMVLQVSENEAKHTERLYDLSQKTNQFNLCLARLNHDEIATCLHSNHIVLTVALRDSLADSGIIACLLARLQGSTAVVFEMLVSCRVLGRDVETLSLLALCLRLQEKRISRLTFAAKAGPRNAPALAWLHGLGDSGADMDVQALTQRLQTITADHPARVIYGWGSPV